LAKYNIGTDNALTKELWEDVLFEDTMKESFFKPLMGTGKDSIIQVKEDLTKQKGDRITFGMVPRGSNERNIRNSGQTLRGHEAAIRDLNFQVTVDEHAFAFADDGPLSRQRALFNVDEETKRTITVAGAEYIDEQVFAGLYDSPTRQIWGGDATGLGDLEAADLITPALISRVSSAAKDGWQREQTPFKGARVDGKNWLVMVVPHAVAYDIKQNSVFQNAWQNARERSPNNPLFSGVIGAWDDVLIKEHENATYGTDAGAGGNIPYGRCLLLGCQALCWAWAEKPKIISEDFDYGREHGHSWQSMFGYAKPKFDTNNNGTAHDYGVAEVVVSTTNIYS
jgi:N4-gp56 family major capsid protein